MNLLSGRSLLSFASNKKTYFFAGGVVVCGVLQSMGVHVPDWLMFVFGGSAIIAHRASVTNLANAIDDIYLMVSQPTPPTITVIPGVGTGATFTAVEPVRTAKEIVKEAAQSPTYKSLPEEEKTEELMNVQLKGK